MNDNNAVFARITQDLSTFNGNFTERLLESIKSKTPVITGRLRDGFMIEKTAEGYDIVNDVPYAGFVEYGTATQRPQGMVRRALLENNLIAAAVIKK